MKVFLIGDGDIVEIITEEFLKNNVDVYVVSIDKNFAMGPNFEKVDSYSEVSKNFFEDRDISSFDKCIVAIGEKNILDAINIAAILQEIGIDTLVIVPTKKYESIFNRIGVNFVVPSYDIASKTVGELLLKSGPVESALPFIEDYFIARINILPESKICNKKVSELDIRNRFNINIIIAFKRESIQLEKGISKTFFSKIDVKAQTVLDETMSIVVVGPLDDIKKFIDYMYGET
ncbi:MAG: hypothetical protein N2712_05710 [Brevinematales bacterium]|nr:hypothetical protein [Brevinematales bacterium]